MEAVAVSVANLSVGIASEKGALAAVDDVSFEIGRGEILALIGESGCGKTMTALAMMRLLPWEATASGRIRVGGKNILGLDRREMEDFRGAWMGMVFQEPMSCLNPVLTISRQMTEGLVRHRKASRGAATERSRAALAALGIREPDRVMRQYPHQLSGGMRQRVMIAAALVLEPELLIADEPTTALDVSVQRRVLDLLVDIKERLGTSILLITHDIGLAGQVADRAAVMQSGRLVESGAAKTLFSEPRHPYTQALLGARLSLDRVIRERGWLDTDAGSATSAGPS